MDLDKKINDLIFQSSLEIDEKDIKILESELRTSIKQILSENNFRTIIDLNNKATIPRPKFEIFRLFGKEDTNLDSSFIPRIVVLGDIHCDVNSLTGIFRKLSISKYNYFENATFIFLGDYIDRGLLPFQTLRFILGLKTLLKERCILIRGNHDHIKYKKEENKFYAEVKPAETVQLFNEYLSAETNFSIFTFLNSLPYLSTIKRNGKNILFTHASIPRDEYSQFFEIQKITALKYEEQEDKGNQIVKLLNSMLWGDPSNVKFKINGTSTRFEFGTEQFEKFMNKTTYTHIFRGHESVEFGIREMYDGKLFTVFSSGGINNDQSYYSDSVPYPGFVIIDEDGNIIQENIFTYRILFNVNNDSVLSAKTYNYFIEDGLTKPYSFLIGGNSKLNNVNIASEKLLNNLKLSNEFSVKLKSTSNLDFIIDAINKNFNLFKKAEKE